MMDAGDSNRRDAHDIRPHEPESSSELELRPGTDGNTSWAEVTDRDGRQIGMFEAVVDGDTIEIQRGHVDEGVHADQAIAMLRAHLDASGRTPTFAETAVGGAPDGRRSIAGDLSQDRGDVRHTDRPDVRDADDRAVNRPDTSAKYPSDYIEATPEQSDHLRRMRELDSDPRTWIDAINPGYADDAARLRSGADLHQLNRVVNCCDCARSVQDTIDGNASVAAAGPPEGLERLDEWADVPRESPDSFGDVPGRLHQPGDAAVLVALYEDRTGHAFNAVNIDGVVQYVDGQTGEVGPWPPEFAPDTAELHGWYFVKGSHRD